jgi:pimeloyl-ACP methyl ester carboxylesterase
MAAEPSAEAAGREWTASVNGTELRVEEGGSGLQTVVFSPNPFLNRALYDAPFAALTSDYRCLRYDQRGQGESGFGVPQPSPDLLGTEGLYNDAVALLDQLGVDSFHWVGSSVGAFVGARLAARHPERVRSLVLLGFSTEPASRVDQLYINIMLGIVRFGPRLGPVGSAMLRRACEQAMRNMFGPTFMSDPARADDRELSRERFMALLVPEGEPVLRAVFGHPGTSPELLARIKAPTLIIGGEEEYGGIGEAQQAQRDIPDARLVTVPGAGHMVLVEQPDAGTAAITEFIRGVDAA